MIFPLDYTFPQNWKVKKIKIKTVWKNKKKTDRTPHVTTPIEEVVGTTSQNEPYLFPDLAITSIYFYVILWKNHLIFYYIESKLPILHPFDKTIILYRTWQYFFFAKRTWQLLSFNCFSYRQTKLTSLMGQKSKLICKNYKKKHNSTNNNIHEIFSSEDPRLKAYSSIKMFI